MKKNNLCNSKSAETINSVLNQTYFNQEWLIVNDFSKDNSCEIINNYIRVIKFYFEKEQIVVKENLTNINQIMGVFFYYCAKNKFN